MKELILALVGGIAVGMVFKLIKMPLPAPPVLAGVLGVFGVYLGGVIIDWLAQLIRSA